MMIIAVFMMGGFQFVPAFFAGLRFTAGRRAQVYEAIYA